MGQLENCLRKNASANETAIKRPRVARAFASKLARNKGTYHAVFEAIGFLLDGLCARFGPMTTCALLYCVKRNSNTNMAGWEGGCDFYNDK